MAMGLGLTIPLSFALAFALTRAEIVARMRAPVITQADGLVQVFADCPEDMRREFQTPVARFAGETVQQLYRGLKAKPERMPSPRIIIHIGDVRTNVSAVVARVSTNGAHAVTRIYVKSPGYADLLSLRTEIVRGFYRGVRGEEIDGVEAMDRYRRSDPRFRIYDERRRVEAWLAGKGEGTRAGEAPWAADERGIDLMRRVIEPGVASTRDVLIFAARLYLYPSTYRETFDGGSRCLSFREATKAARDVRVRLAAYHAAPDMLVLGGGRGEEMSKASQLYYEFLLALASGERKAEELRELLERADIQLNLAFEDARKREEG